MSDSLVLIVGIVAILAALAIVGSRRIDSIFLSLLIIITPISAASFMPREIAGVTGLNIFNIVWLLAAVSVGLKAVIGKIRHTKYSFLSVYIVCFWIVYFAGFAAALLNIDLLPKYGPYVVTNVSLVLEKLGKPLQIFLTGWLVYLHCKRIDGYKVIENSIFVAALVSSGMILYYFFSGVVGTGYVEGRDVVTSSSGLHANSMGALSVFFLIFAIASNVPERWKQLLRYFVIGVSILGVVFSFSRIAYLTTAIMVPILFFRMSRGDKLATISITTAVLLAFSVLIVQRVTFGVESSKSNFSRNELNTISAGRIDSIWVPLWKDVERRPLFGGGVYTILKSDAYHKGLMLNTPHSAYLEALLDLGVFGLVVVLAMLFYMYRVGRKTKSNLQYLMVAMFLLSSTGHSFYPYLANYLVWIVYGMAIAGTVSTRNVQAEPQSLIDVVPLQDDAYIRHKGRP